MSQYRFIRCDKCTALLGEVDDEGGYAYMEVGGMLEISVSFSLFCCEP